MPQELPPVRNLSGSQALILKAVHAAGPHGLRSTTLVDLVYDHDINGGPEDGINAVHSMVRKLNKKLKPINKTICAPGGHGPSCYVLRDIEPRQDEHDLLHE